MRMWLRQATLTLGSNQYTLDGLNFSFKVQFEDRAKVSTAQLEVYNLSPSTRASLKKGDAVIITAGYKGDVGCIFVGAIADYSHQHENLDIITKITAADCLEEWLGTYVNKTYKAGMYAKDIIDDLLNIFGVEVAMVKLAENKHYPGCRVCRGKLKDVLTEIGLQRLQVQAGDPLRADHHKPARGRNHDRLSADAADGPAEIGIDIRKPEHQHEDHGDGEDAQPAGRRRGQPVPRLPAELSHRRRRQDRDPRQPDQRHLYGGLRRP